MVKKLSQLYLDTRNLFAKTEDAHTAGMMATELLCSLTGKTREALLAQFDTYVTDDVCEKLEAATARILEGEPLAYVLGQWDFHGMTLHVDRNVLIPRDDTCAVTDMAIKKALFLDASPRILDLCTGSGCIGLAIANRVKDARVTLADISKEALTVAKKNATEQKLSGRVHCIIADALQPPKPFLGQFDMIVSNPPYVTTLEMKELPDSVRNFEPHLALHGGTDGLNFYRAIAANYKTALRPGGYLCFEFGMDQGDSVCNILQDNGYQILERTRDYNDRERAVLAQYGRKDD